MTIAVVNEFGLNADVLVGGRDWSFGDTYWHHGGGPHTNFVTDMDLRLTSRRGGVVTFPRPQG